MAWAGTGFHLEVNGSNLDLKANQLAGWYESPAVDTGAIATYRVGVRVLTSSSGSDDPTWDAATFTWDSLEGQSRTWDGPLGQDVLTMSIEIRYADTEPGLAITTYEKFVFREKNFRWCQFKIHISVQDFSFSGSITDAFLCVDAIEIRNQEEALNVPGSSSPLSVVYDTTFVDTAKVALNVTLLDPAVTGEYFVITNRTTTGFDIEIFDAADATQTSARTIAYIANGF